MVHIWNLWQYPAGFQMKQKLPFPDHIEEGPVISVLQLEFPWSEERQRIKSSTSPPTRPGSCRPSSAHLSNWPLLPSSFPSLSGVLPMQAAQACFQFLEHLRLTSPEALLPKSSHCLECSPQAWQSLPSFLLPQLNHTSLGRPGHSSRSTLPITHSCS